MIQMNSAAGEAIDDQTLDGAGSAQEEQPVSLDMVAGPQIARQFDEEDRIVTIGERIGVAPGWL